MKSNALILSGVIGTLLLGGCAEGGQSNLPETTAPTYESQSDAQTYRQVILQLQQELETLRAQQIQQTDHYETKIRELETMIEYLKSDRLEGTDHENTEHTSQQAVPYTYSVIPSGVVITSYTGKNSLAEIPSLLDGLPVIGIGEGAFRNSAVEQVIVPEGVTYIDWFAFQGSYRLSSVILPSSVISIEYGAFELCSSSLKFTCPPDSYAAKYAVSYGIPVISSSHI